MNYEELVKNRKNIGDMTKEELFTYCGGLLSEVWDYEKENIDLQNRLNSLMEAHKNSEEEIERLNNIINKGIEAINVYQNEKTLSIGYQDLKRIRGILRGNEFDLKIFEEYLQELKGVDKE